MLQTNQGKYPSLICCIIRQWQPPPTTRCLCDKARPVIYCFGSKSSIQYQISRYRHTALLLIWPEFCPYQVNHCLDTDTSNFHLICTLHITISKYTFCIGQQEYSQLSPGMILMSGVVHDTGILLFTSRSIGYIVEVGFLELKRLCQVK